MKKLLSTLMILFLAVCPSLSYGGGLDFSTTGSSRVDHGSATSLDNLDPSTWIIIFRMDAQTVTYALTHRSGNGGGSDRFAIFIHSSGILVTTWTSSTSLPITCHSASSHYIDVTDRWYAVTAVVDTAGTNDCRQYMTTDGYVTNITMEEVSYNNQSNNAAGLHAISSTNQYIGGDGSNDALDGVVSTIAVFAEAMTLDEANEWLLNPGPRSTMVLWSTYGVNGTGTQPDWSGVGNTGSVTSATLGDSWSPWDMEPWSVHRFASFVAATGTVPPLWYYYKRRRSQ